MVYIKYFSGLRDKSAYLTQDIDPVLDYGWVIVRDAGPTRDQRTPWVIHMHYSYSLSQCDGRQNQIK